MAGQQATFATLGAQYEDIACQLIGRIAALTRVPREQDYGIDFYCQVREHIGPTTVGVSDLFTVQVKGAEDLAYGGCAENGKWKAHEIAWLRSLGTPLYLCRVAQDFSAVDLYSLGPLWRVLWNTRPFQIRCVTRPCSGRLFVLADATAEQVAPADDSAAHDGIRWTVDLGPPFLRLTNGDLNDHSFAAGAAACLKRWLHVDRMSLVRFQLRVAVINNIATWTTNDFSSAPPVLNRAMYWSPQKGMNVADLAPLASEVLVNLGVNLQWQNDRGAYSLLDALEYLDALGAVDPFGKGLIAGLRNTQAQELDPKPE